MMEHASNHRVSYAHVPHDAYAAAASAVFEAEDLLSRVSALVYPSVPSLFSPGLPQCSSAIYCETKRTESVRTPAPPPLTSYEGYASWEADIFSVSALSMPISQPDSLRYRVLML